MDFFTGWSIIIMYSYFSLKKWFAVKNNVMLDSFQLLSSPDVNRWTGVVWHTRLSFWRHPFTAEHPSVRPWCRDTFLQTWWRNKLILILEGLRVMTLSANLHFQENYSFNDTANEQLFLGWNKWQCTCKLHILLHFWKNVGGPEMFTVLKVIKWFR